MDSRPPMLTTHPYDDDKLREECGIFGIWGDQEAAANVALGLHALQHRGQEAAGIVTADKGHFHAECAEFWFVLLGKISYRMEGVPDILADEGDVVYVPRETPLSAIQSMSRCQSLQVHHGIV